MDYKTSLQNRSIHYDNKTSFDTRDLQSTLIDQCMQVNIKFNQNLSNNVKSHDNQIVLKRFSNQNPVKKGFLHLRKNSDPLQHIKIKRQVRLSHEGVPAMPEIVKKKETFDNRSQINYSFLKQSNASSINFNQSKSALAYQKDLRKTVNDFNPQKTNGHYRVRSQVNDSTYEDINIDKFSRNYKKQNLNDSIGSSSFILRQENYGMEEKYQIPERLMIPKYVKQTLNSTFYLPLSTLSTNISTLNAHVIPAGRDTSLSNATNEINRRWKRYKKMQNDLVNLKASQCDIVKKQILIKQFKLQLPHIKLSEFDIMSLSSYDLETLFYREIHKIKQAQAAIKIQSIYKMHKQRFRYLNIRKERLIAKEKIKNMWKKCRWHRLVKQMTQQKKNDAAIRVQKYLMGFIISRKVIQDLANKKVEDSRKYFEAKKLEVQINAQIKISYFWRRYKRQSVKRQQNQNKNLGINQKGKFQRRSTKDYSQKPGPSWGYSKLSKQKTLKQQ